MARRQQQYGWPKNILFDLLESDEETLNNICSSPDCMDGFYYWLSTLDARGEDVLRSRYERGETLALIGKRYGLSVERIRQIERESLRKLRYPSKIKYFLYGVQSVRDSRKSPGSVEHLGVDNVTYLKIRGNGVETVRQLYCGLSSSPERWIDTLGAKGYYDILQMADAYVEMHRNDPELLKRVTLNSPIADMGLPSNIYAWLLRYVRDDTVGSVFELSERDLEEIFPHRGARNMFKLQLSQFLPVLYARNNTLIDDLDVSFRVKNALWNAGIHTVEQFLELPPRAVVRIRNLGQRSIQEVYAKMEELGHDTAFKTRAMVKSGAVDQHTRIDDLDVSNRIKNALHRAGIETVEHFLSLTPKQVSRIRNLGVSSVAEVYSKMAELGFDTAFAARKDDRSLDEKIADAKRHVTSSGTQGDQPFVRELEKLPELDDDER